MRQINYQTVLLGLTTGFLLGERTPLQKRKRGPRGKRGPAGTPGVSGPPGAQGLMGPMAPPAGDSETNRLSFHPTGPPERPAYGVRVGGNGFPGMED